MLPTIWGACDSSVCMLILDIPCQQLGGEYKLEGFSVPFGYRFGIFRNIYLDWIFDANNLGSICHLKIYVDIGYIMPKLGR